MEIDYESLKTGDLVLFHALDNINPLIIGSYWGHVGIVVIHDGKPMIFEAAGIERKLPGNNSNGIYFSDLQTRIKQYRGYVAIKKLKNPLSQEICTEFNTFIEFARKNMHYEKRVFQHYILHLLGYPCDLATNCGELVFLSLIKLGLLPISTYDEHCWHYLLKVIHITKLLNNSYSSPIYTI